MIALFFIFLGGTSSFAQNTDSLQPTPVIVHKDFRISILERKQLELNTAATKQTERTAIGYRLQVLSTSDREYVMKTRTQLLQRYPEQKVYMMYLAPYVKLKFGNFKTKQEADSYKSQISKMLGGSSIYTLTERIEIKPEKDPKDDSLK